MGDPRRSINNVFHTPTTGRPSIAAGRVSRGNIASELAGMSLSQEAASKIPMMGRMSLGPTPRQSLGMTRRSSGFGGKQSFGGTAPTAPLQTPTAPTRDPRPVRDKTFQANCIKILLGHLAQTGYPHPISQKILQAPSAKDFQQIFRFLYGQLDGSYEWGGGRKFEEEVPALMRALRYPFASEISKSQLYAVGSMHAWPSLLAMLGWMVELVMCGEEIIHTEDPSTPERIFFDYLADAYSVFLGGGDNFDAAVSGMAAKFDQRNEAHIGEVERLADQVGQLEMQYGSLTQEEAPLAKAQRERGIYASDIEKFAKFIGHLRSKRQKFIEAIGQLEEDLRLHEADLRQAEQERTALQAQVDAQDICPEDIDRMNAEKDQLLRTLESLGQAKEEASRLFWDRELLVQKRLDVVERMLFEYNSLAERLGLFINGNGNGSDNSDSFELQFNPQASRLVNLDLRGILQPALLRLRDEAHAVTHQTQDQLLNLQEALDRLTEALSDRQEDLGRMEERTRRILQTYLDEKDAASLQSRHWTDQSDQLEMAIQRIRSDSAASRLQAQQRLQAAHLQHDELVGQLAGEKELVAAEVYRILEELINFKTHTEGSLGELDGALAKEQLYLMKSK